MKKHFRMVYKLFSVLLIMLTVISTIYSASMTADAASISKTQKSYDIAIVYDNSGSMYSEIFVDQNGNITEEILNQRWCRAKYAMEIFASMLNYSNDDKLQIFPMWGVTTDGSKPESGSGSYAPIEIKNEKDFNKISKMYTLDRHGTPFAPVEEAYAYLKTSDATEKWLIVLTDGAFNQASRDENEGASWTEEYLRERLLACATNDIHVQYLGFGGASELQSDESKKFYAKKSTDASLQEDLIDICNAIFQRSVLPDNYLDGKELKLDLSMKNLIVFVQGPDAKITSLKDDSGNEIDITLNSGQRKYSTIAARFCENPDIDDSLAGQVVTFAACAACTGKDTYTLEYTDAEKVQIFYEPDVDIAVTLTDSDGVVVDGSSGEIAAGDYIINRKIVDSKTGEDVTSHPLMGNDVNLITKVKTSAEGDYTTYKNGATVTLAEDSSTDILVEGTYLKEYTITSEGSKDLAWLNGLKVVQGLPKFNVKASVTQTGSWYRLKEHDNWKPIKVTFSVDGQKLTDEQLEAANMNVVGADKLPYRCELLSGESAYNIYIGQDKDGNYVEPELGKYKLNFSATYTDENGEEIKGESNEVSIEVGKYSQFIIWLLRNLWWILLILFLIIAIILYMTKKVLPNSIYKENSNYTSLSSDDLGDSADFTYSKKGKSISIEGPNGVDWTEKCSASFTLKPIDRRYTPSKRRRIVITGISSVCEKVTVGAVSYVNVEGQWVKTTQANAVANGKEVPDIEQTLSSIQFTLEREPAGTATLKCKARAK